MSQSDGQQMKGESFLTWLHLPPDDQIHLAVPCCPVHQINDVSVRLPHHWDPVHEQQLIAGPQASIQVRRTLLYDGADQDLSLKCGLLNPGSSGPMTQLQECHMQWRLTWLLY